VKARVEQAGGERVGGRAVPPGVSVQLSYDWEGQRRESWGMLEGREPPDEVILTKSTIPIRVDPEDPQRWTYRRQPPGIVADLLGAALAFALAPLALLASVALRRGVLRTWRDGEAADAIVVGRHGTALAPGTRAVKCTPAGPQAEEEAEGAPAQPEPHHAPAGGGSRVHTVYVPLRHGDAAGDLLRVILPPRGKGRPLAAAWFE
jgi:hypothetical protein